MTDKAQRKVGIAIYDEAGSLIIELGAFVIAENPAFAQAIGALAAEWAHAEAELSAYLAALMNTSADRTFALMAPYGRRTGPTVQAAVALAEATLPSDELADFKAVMARFTKLGEERNTIQHALWARKPSEDGLMFPVKALDYAKFSKRVMDIDNATSMAESFAASLTEGWTVDELSRMASDIRQLTIDLCSARMAWLRSQVSATVTSGL